MATMVDDRVWISRRRAAVMLAITPEKVDRLIDRRLLTVRSIPGTNPKVLLDDVQRIARESVIPAEVGATA